MQIAETPPKRKGTRHVHEGIISRVMIAPKIVANTAPKTPDDIKIPVCAPRFVLKLFSDK